jgi:hypothetical protein
MRDLRLPGFREVADLVVDPSTNKPEEIAATVLAHLDGAKTR